MAKLSFLLYTFMSEWCSSGANMKKSRMEYSPELDRFLILGEEF